MEARLRRPAAVMALAVPLITGLVVLISGYDLAWDFLNYHYYDGYAVFHDRTRDIAPAGLHTYFNPTIEIPFYLGVNYLPVPAFGFLFGVVSGLNFPLVFFLSRKVLQSPDASLLAFFSALFAISSANFAIELGAVYHDNLVSLFFLAGLLLLFYVPNAKRPLLLLALAGATIGAGVGLKLTLAPFLIATAAFLPLLYRPPLGSLMRAVAVFTVAALIGVLIPSAWWMLHLWHAFGNPLFPMFNSFFRSPYAAALSYSDHRFLPHSVLEWIAFPLLFTFDYRKAGINMALDDFRYLVAYLGFAVAAVLVVARRRVPAANILMQPDAARFLIAVVIAAFAVWEISFGVSRYLLPLDLLLSLTGLAWLQLLKWTSRRAQLAWAAGFTLIALTTSLSHRTHIAWSPALMSVEVPPIPDNSMVVMAGTAPMSYLIPGFPPHVAFVRVSLEDGFGDRSSGGITAIGSLALLARKARDAIASHKGDLYVLYGRIPKREPLEGNIVSTTLERLHLRRGTCAPVKSPLHYVGQTYELCKLARL